MKQGFIVMELRFGRPCEGKNIWLGLYVIDRIPSKKKCLILLY